MRKVCVRILLLAALLAALWTPALANELAESGPFASIGPEMPRLLAALYSKQQNELLCFASFNTALTVYDPATQTVPTDLHEEARSLLQYYENTPNGIVLLYAPATGEAAIAYGEAVADVLTSEDAAAIEAAFAAPDSADAYVHVINGLKALLVRVFDGGAFEIPAYSYAAESLRDPESVPDAAPLPDTRLILNGLAEAEEAQLVYLGNEIGRFAGLSVDVVMAPAADGMTLADSAEGYRTASYETDPDTTVVLTCDPDTGEAAVAMSPMVAEHLPSDAAGRVAAALSQAEGRDFDRALAGLEELARVLYADGTLEFDANSGIALALDPAAFSSPGVPAAVWMVLVAVLLAAAAVAVALRVRRRRAHPDLP